MINLFFIKFGFDTYKNALIMNLLILFVFFCAFESIDLSFLTDMLFVLIYIMI